MKPISIVLLRLTTALLGFQVFHFLEHAIQLTYWFLHPKAAPYMTPWAMSGVEVLGLWSAFIPGSGEVAMRGMELLHLIGNVLFLCGLVGLICLVRQSKSGLYLNSARTAAVIQSVHVAEHVLLVATLFLLGRPLGLSTAFGLAEGAGWASSYRVWFHFLINFGASVPATMAALGYWQQSQQMTTPIGFSAK